MNYCAGEHFERILEGFATLYYGTQAGGTGTIEIATSVFESDINSSFNRINNVLDGFDRVQVVPIGTESNGSYNQALVDWNVLDTIYTKLVARHWIQLQGNMPDWMSEFGSRARKIECDIKDGYITFEVDTTQKGIGYPIRVAGTGASPFYSNWDTGYYEGSDFEKTFHFRINSVTDGTTPNKAQFIVSDNGGYSWWDGTYTTGTDWASVKDGLQVRWGYTTGTNPMLVVGDEWKINCVPVNKISQGQSSGYKTFRRG